MAKKKKREEESFNIVGIEEQVQKLVSGASFKPKFAGTLPESFDIIEGTPPKSFKPSAPKRKRGASEDKIRLGSDDIDPRTGQVIGVLSGESVAKARRRVRKELAEAQRKGKIKRVKKKFGGRQ